MYKIFIDMKKMVTLSESQLSSLIKTIINEIGIAGEGDRYFNNKDVTTKKISSKVYKLSKLLFSVRNKAWDDSIAKTLFNNESDMLYLSLAIFSWVKKHPSYNLTFLKCAIAGVIRESKGSVLSYFNPKEIFGVVNNLFGGNSSQGYAQMQPSVAKKYGINFKSLYTLEGSLNAIYKLYSTDYIKAKKYYNGNYVTMNINGKLTKIPAINNDAALHMTVASYNAGDTILNSWCQTNDPKLGNICSTGKPNTTLKTYKNKPIPNYFPNVGGVYKYIPQYRSLFNSLSFLTKSMLQE